MDIAKIFGVPSHNLNIYFVKFNSVNEFGYNESTELI